MLLCFRRDPPFASLQHTLSRTYYSSSVMRMGVSTSLQLGRSRSDCGRIPHGLSARFSGWAGPPHTWLTSTKRFTNLKVNLKHLGLYIGAKMQLVSYEFEYFYQCIMTFWGLRDSKGPILMHQAHLVQN